ncbi:MAG TPA: glycosyltransferase family 9 protein [Candidatus Saccharimonadales bacterium]|nr:glycosyltransferase family 9 protein [Candidatus Saccharimonadales bacterium]
MSHKILVIRGGALGDFILTLPVLAALRLQFPGHRLQVLGYPAVASLAVAGGLADAVDALESPRLSGFFVADGSWSEEAADYFAGFDLIVSYLYDANGVFRRNVARCSSAQFIVGPHRPDETLHIHATELLLRPLGMMDVDSQPRLILPLTPAPEFRLAIHPGSGSPRKNWPEAQWSELLQSVAVRTKVDFLLIGGEAEGERCARLAAVLPAGRVQIAQSLPLPELAARMKACSAFIGHDSGITHLAAALDLSGLVLWGETALATWRPKSPRLKVLPGISSLEVDSVWRELAGLLER